MKRALCKTEADHESWSRTQADPDACAAWDTLIIPDCRTWAEGVCQSVHEMWRTHTTAGITWPKALSKVLSPDARKLGNRSPQSKVARSPAEGPRSDGTSTVGDSDARSESSRTSSHASLPRVFDSFFDSSKGFI